MKRLWIWYGQVSHRVVGLGNSFGGEGIIYGYEFVTCTTKCGLRVQVNVPPESSLSDACQPKGRPACPECEAAE